MMHLFLIVNTCYWHHEWERCGVCGAMDKPDEPELPQHFEHDEAVENTRMRTQDPVRWERGERMSRFV